MPHPTTISQSPSIIVVQGTYEWLLVQPLQRPESLQTRKKKGKLSLYLAEETYQFLLFNSHHDPYHPSLVAPVTDVEATDEDRTTFESLVAQWRRERGARSSITEAVLCLSYQGIIGMGPKAVGLILDQLISEGDDPDQWFWALRVLTGHDPVKDEDGGNYQKMAQAWLQWAKTTKYAR